MDFIRNLGLTPWEFTVPCNPVSIFFRRVERDEYSLFTRFTLVGKKMLARKILTSGRSPLLIEPRAFLLGWRDRPDQVRQRELSLAALLANAPLGSLSFCDFLPKPASAGTGASPDPPGLPRTGFPDASR